MACAKQRRWGRIVELCCGFFLVAGTMLPAQEAKSPETPPNDLVRQTVEREVADANNTQIKHMFRSRKQTPKGSQTRLYVETNDSMAGILVAVNDQPVTEQQQQAEQDHLSWLVNSPEQ